MKKIFNIVFVIIGTLIGAGFASGQEIYTFFFSHGIKGIYGILISCILMGIIIYKVLVKVKIYNIKTYKEFLDIIIFSKQSKGVKIKEIINNVINIFIVITFFIMIAGFGAYFEQELGINKIIGSSILAILCFFIFMSNVEGVIKSSETIVPILIISIFVIGILNINDIQFLNIQNYMIEANSSNFILDAIIYCSYNTILLISVLITLLKYLKDKKQILKISVITIVITTIMSLIIFFVLTRIDVDIANLEMPIVYVISHMSKILRYIYGFIILGSIFTTAISLGVSFLQNISKNKRSYTQFAFIICITSIIISNFGFSNLVNLLYPIFGFWGLIQIGLLCNKS